MFKLDIKKVLNAIDSKNLSFYSSLSDEEKKSISFWLLMRFASSSKHFPENALLMTNECINTNFADLKNHPELMWMLLCLTSSKLRDFHKFIKPPAKSSDKLVKELKALYPEIKIEDIRVYIQLSTLDEVEEVFKQHGYQDDQIKKILNDYKKRKV